MIDKVHAHGTYCTRISFFSSARGTEEVRELQFVSIMPHIVERVSKHYTGNENLSVTALFFDDSEFSIVT